MHCKTLLLTTDLFLGGDSEMTDIGSHAGVTHAMITADGRAVPITIHPETGAYMTPDGQTLVTQEVDGQQVYWEECRVILAIGNFVEYTLIVPRILRGTICFQ